MTPRRSKRELERAIEELGGDRDESGEWSDVGAGVTAPFVTYADENEDVDAPGGWEVSTEDGAAGATYQVLSRAEGEQS